MQPGFHFFLTKLGGGDIDGQHNVDVVFANDAAEAERFVVSKRITTTFSYKYCGFIDNAAVALKLDQDIEGRQCAIQIAAAVRLAKRDYEQLLTPNEKATLERTATKIEKSFFA